MRTMKLEQLTPSERLWLWRKRRGWKQSRAAEALGYARQRYSLMENGHRPIRRLRVGTYEDFTPTLNENLSPQEVLALLRRRADVRQRPMAAAMGVSEPTLRKWEEQGAEQVFAWWRARKSLQKLA